MVFEIVHAHAESGILKGTKGFCPVAVTEGLTSKRVKPLHDLARKQVIHAAEFWKTGGEGNFYSYFPIKLDDRKFDLLTRGDCISDAARNKVKFVVHQILVDHDSNPWDCGPASILAREDLWVTRWSTKPQLLKVRNFEMPPLSPRVCNTWEKMTRDSGWAGSPVAAFEKRKSLLVLANESIESKAILELFVESASLLKKQFRWDIPFTIRAWHPFGEDRPFWNVVDVGTQDAIDSLHRDDIVRVDLTHSMPRATGKYANDARSGNWVSLDLVKKSSIDLAGEEEEEIKLAPADELVAGSFVMSGSSTKLASVSSIRRQEDIDKAIAEQKRAATQAGLRGDNGATVARLSKEQPQTKQEDEAPEQNGESTTHSKPSKPKKRKVTTNNDHVLAANVAAAPEKSWLENNKSKLIRWSVGLVALLVVGGIIYAGIGFIQQAFSLADNMGSKGITIIGSGNNDSDPDNENQPKESEKSNTEKKPDPAPEIKKPATPKRAVATKTDLVNVFKKNLTTTRYMAIALPGKADAQPMFSLPTPLPGFAPLVKAYLLDGNERQTLKWNEAGDQLSVTIDKEGERTEVGTISLTEVELDPADTESGAPDSDTGTQTSSTGPIEDSGEASEPEKSYRTDFTWRWTEAALGHETKVLELLAGQLQLQLSGTRQSMNIGMAEPVKSPKFRFVDPSFERVLFEPHLSKLLATKEGFSKFSWKVSDISVVASDESEAVWIGKVDMDLDRAFLYLDPEYVRTKAEEILGEDLSSGTMAEVFADRLRFHGPLSISAKTSIAVGSPNDSNLELKFESQFDFRNTPEDIQCVYFNDIPGVSDATPTEKKINGLPDHLVKKLMVMTGIRGKQGYRIITEGGKGASKAPNNVQKCSVAIAGIYYEAAIEAMERELQVEIVRRGGTKRFQFESKVFKSSSDPENSSN